MYECGRWTNVSSAIVKNNRMFNVARGHQIDLENCQSNGDYSVDDDDGHCEDDDDDGDDDDDNRDDNRDEYYHERNLGHDKLAACDRFCWLAARLVAISETQRLKWHGHVPNA